ncbi:hypothetical protein CORC01_06592 [Colletotrichum orchidophilum]|uniref:PD-(D/E)XK nuclease-like domain-containing protein n=1 Tax=Colletotrichum orchidophilum TaxID=1209926 RepID=A0A1G4B9K2_9PEZI|nr:uncharacterized protein CORC01_06592 [Colletotrichum orchidophilum]OHE98078.1 hypothetical protein CORC01_06592 [Colletotrichum orchidophilum]
MLENSVILDWLCTLPPTPATAPLPLPLPEQPGVISRKRKRSSLPSSPHRLPSPPLSFSQKESCAGIHVQGTMEVCPDQGAMSSHEPDISTPRRNLATHLPPNPDADPPDSDLEPTPKAPRLNTSSRATRQIPQSDTSSIASSSAASQLSFQTTSSASNASKRKRQASPRKHSNLMAIENSISEMSFDGLTVPPPALNNILNSIEILGRGIGIVSRTQEAALRSKAESNRQFRWVRDDTFAPDLASPTSTLPSSIGAQPHRDQLGPTPDFDTINEIWWEAFDAETVRHEEGQWNSAVHRPLLHNALKHIQSIGVCNCTSAQIHSSYTRSDKSAHHNKKVDFCVYVKEESEQLKAKIPTTPAQSINHTDYPGLLQRPIGLSIETKITGHEWAKAVNQIAVWLVAQWDALDDLAAPSDGSHSTPRSVSSAAAAGLVFLPGIIVQGHEWWFIAVTRKPDGKTELWTKTPIGSTTTMQGIYQISAVIQLLGRWIETEYWPWFQRAILKQT